MRLLVTVKGGPDSGNWGHAGRPGLVGGSAAGSVSPNVEKVISKTGVPDSARGALLNQLQGLPDKYFKGLKEITCDAPPGYEMREDAYYDEYGDSAIGAYMNDRMYVHPKAVGDGVTVVHELGHHISDKGELRFDYDQLVFDKLALDIHHNRIDYTSMGLRPYSVSNGWEFMADSFKVWRYGTDKQWTALNDFVAGRTMGNLNPGKLFGPRLDLPR